MVDVVSAFERGPTVSAFSALRFVHSLNVRFLKETGGVSKSGASVLVVGADFVPIALPPVTSSFPQFRFVSEWPPGSGGSEKPFPISDAPVLMTLTPGWGLRSSTIGFAHFFWIVLFPSRVAYAFGWLLSLLVFYSRLLVGRASRLWIGFVTFPPSQENTISVRLVTSGCTCLREFLVSEIPSARSNLLGCTLLGVRLACYRSLSHLGCSTVQLVRGAVSPARGGGVSHSAVEVAS